MFRSELRLSIGLTLRMLPKDGQDGREDIIKPDGDLRLEDVPAQTNTDGKSKIQMLISTIPSDSKKELVYVEYKSYELSGRRGVDKQIIKRASNLGNLLRYLDAWDAGFHTLCLKYVIQQKDSARFAFVFQLPNGKSQLITLLESFEATGFLRPTLGERFRIARELSQTLFQFHAVGWRHKSIRSENVLLVKSDESHIAYSPQYIVGFEFSRAENNRSTTEQDDVLERNIYRHPDRQGPPEERFHVRHDIYTLGVMLLEIDLWRLALKFGNFSNMNADKIKECLEEHARYRLPHYMGGAYTDVVLACLKGALGNYDQNNLSESGPSREAILPKEIQFRCGTGAPQ